MACLSGFIGLEGPDMVLNNLYNRNPLACEKQLRGHVKDGQLSHESKTTLDFNSVLFTSQVRTNKLLEPWSAAISLQRTLK